MIKMKLLIILVIIMFTACTVQEEEVNKVTGEVFLTFEKNWITNKKNGECVYYYENGNVQTKLNYKNGKKDGECLSYYKNGQLKFKVEYKNDALWNIYESYGSTGNKLDFGSIKDGEGYIKKYDSDGVLNEEGTVKKGFKEGVWKSYLKGSPFYMKTYKKGKEVGVINDMVNPIFY